MNEVRYRCLYIFSLSAKVLLGFHIKAENRRPKVTVSHLLDQHVMAVYWLWKSSEGQVQFTMREQEYDAGQGLILLNQHGSEFFNRSVNGYQLIQRMLFITNFDYIHVRQQTFVAHSPTEEFSLWSFILHGHSIMINNTSLGRPIKNSLKVVKFTILSQIYDSSFL